MTERKDFTRLEMHAGLRKRSMPDGTLWEFTSNILTRQTYQGTRVAFLLSIAVKDVVLDVKQIFYLNHIAHKRLTVVKCHYSYTLVPAV